MEVNMWRRVLPTAFAASLVLGVAGTVTAQSNGAKIASAMAAAPASIAKDAAVKDWPDSTGKMATIREGSNGWVCYPSRPETKYRKNDAMCLDAAWQEWMAAYAEKRAPKVSHVGYAYMLAADEWGSNTGDNKGLTPDNQWHHMGPHVMVLYPDASMLAGIPARPSMSGPYVMMSGSPFVHVMWPVK
jgi:hypothetical protein